MGGWMDGYVRRQTCKYARMCAQSPSVFALRGRTAGHPPTSRLGSVARQYGSASRPPAAVSCRDCAGPPLRARQARRVAPLPHPRLCALHRVGLCGARTPLASSCASRRAPHWPRAPCRHARWRQQRAPR
eukprot:16117-Chlamydomonas_euryale.AAC.1